MYREISAKRGISHQRMTEVITHDEQRCFNVPNSSESRRCNIAAALLSLFQRCG